MYSSETITSLLNYKVPVDMVQLSRDPCQQHTFVNDCLYFDTCLVLGCC